MAQKLALKLSKLPFLKPKESIAVDIGSTAIKILHLKQSGSKYSLIKWGVIPINEDWGLIPVEASVYEKATIGTNEGGLKETIVDNKTGFLLNEITPEKIAEKIDYLANNKKMAIKMGKQARKHNKKFDWKNTLPVIDDGVATPPKS